MQACFNLMLIGKQNISLQLDTYQVYFFVLLFYFVLFFYLFLVSFYIISFHFIFKLIIKDVNN